MPSRLSSLRAGWGRKWNRLHLRVSRNLYRYVPAKMRKRYVMYRAVVEKPEEFGRLFNSGEKVLQLHFYPKNAREMVAAVNGIIARAPEIAERGYFGFYGDTPNTALINLWKKRGAMIVESPSDESSEARRHYAYGVTHLGWPKEYLSSPVQRIVFPFS
ncbi:MAG: hypothetical protein AABW68_05070 [archaeon]